jgi:hypothetical protein
MKHIPSLILAVAIVLVLGFSGHLTSPSPEKALAQFPPSSYTLPDFVLNAIATGAGNSTSTDSSSAQAASLQYVKTIWEGFVGSPNGAIRFPVLPFWLRDGYVVVTDGMCLFNDAKGGFKVFREDGTFVGEGDTCVDSVMSGDRPADLGLSAHIWGTGNSNYAIVDGNSFVIGGEESGSWPYPPKLYSVSAGGVSLDASAWKLKLRNGDSNPPSLYTRDESPSATGYALVGSTLFGHTADNARNRHDRITAYSLSALSILNETSSTVYPVADVGGYVIAESGTGGSKTLGLYKVTSGNKLDRVQTFFAGTLDKGGFKDPSNPNRFALRKRSSEDIHIYTLSDGAAVESEVRHAPSAGTASDRGVADAFALLGDTLVYGSCTSQQGANRKCHLVVDKAGTKTNVEFPDGDAKIGVEGMTVSQNGTVAIVAWGDNGIGKVYLFKIAGVYNTPPSTVGSTPQGMLQLNGVEGNLDLAKGYLLLLQALFGKQTTVTEKSSVETGTSTQFQTLFQQAVDLINAYGQ